MPPLRDGASVIFWPPGEKVCKAGTLREVVPRRFVVLELGTGRRWPADGRLRYRSIDGVPCNQAVAVPWWAREVADA